MKDFLPKPPKSSRHEKVTAVKRSVISSLRGVPLLHLADTLYDTNETVNNQDASEICSADTCEKNRRREKDKNNVREVGEKDVQVTKTVL